MQVIPSAQLVPACLSVPVLSCSCPVPSCLPLSYFLCLPVCLCLFYHCLPLRMPFLPKPVCICRSDYRLCDCQSMWLSSVCLSSLWLSSVCLPVFVTIDCLLIIIVCLLSASPIIVRLPVFISYDLFACLSLWLSSVCMPISLNIACVPIWLSDYHLYAYLFL